MEEKRDIRYSPKFELLFEENIQKFNQMVTEGRPPDLTDANLSGMDLRKANLKGLDLSGCYMRGANLSGLDLTGCRLAGASLKAASISGVLFPENISPEEIRLSVEHGTRLRVT